MPARPSAPPPRCTTTRTGTQPPPFLPGRTAATWTKLTLRSGNEVDKKVFNGLSTGDAPITDNIKSIRTDAITDTWFAYQDNDGQSCKGDLIKRVADGECIKVADLGIGCTRLCGGGLGGGGCASTTA